MGKTKIASDHVSDHVVCHTCITQNTIGLSSPSSGLLVLCILLQVFALDGYTTRKFSIVLYAWVSLIVYADN
jgi:hypothetical protein